MDEQPKQPGYWLSVFSLLTSSSTLVCCALPALLVTIGAGASLAGLVSTAPWLVALSKYKVITFSLSGLMLAVAGLSLWRARNAPCPIDPAMARLCSTTRRLNVWIFSISLLLWATGFFFAFVAVHVLL